MPSDIKNIVITSAVRTPIGTFRGSLKDMKASDLGATVIKAALEKSWIEENIPDAEPQIFEIDPKFRFAK